MTARTITEIADLYVIEQCALNPFVASAVGDPEFADGLPDFTSDGYLTKAAHDRRVLADLAGTQPHSPHEEALRLAMTERLEVSIAEHDVGLDRLLNARDCPVQQIPAAISAMPRRTAEDWEAIDVRLEAVPEALAGYVETVHEDLDTGLLPTRRQAERVVAQSRRLAAGHFTGIVSEADVDGRLRRRLRDHARRAQTAYRRFARFARVEVVERSAEGDGLGRERYAVALRSAMGEDVDIDEAYAWAARDLEQITAEMNDAVEQLAPGASLAQAFEELDVRAQYRAPGTDAFLRWMTEVVQAAHDEVGRELALPPGTDAPECVLSRGTPGHIVYVAADGDRPAQLRWSPEEGADQYVTWPHTVTLLHEGIPGRHVWTSVRTSADASANAWQRDLVLVPGQDGGWASYAEGVGERLGWLDDPGYRIGALDKRRFHSARLLAETGLHCDLDVPPSVEPLIGPTWDADAMVRLLASKSRLARGVIERRVPLYLAQPGQGAVPRLGARAWETLREKDQAAHGDGWDPVDFHARAFSLGPMGMGPMRVSLLSPATTAG